MSLFKSVSLGLAVACGAAVSASASDASDASSLVQTALAAGSASSHARSLHQAGAQNNGQGPGGQQGAPDCGLSSAEIGRWTGSDCDWVELDANTVGECDAACMEDSAIACAWIDTDSECRTYTLVDPDDPSLDDCKIEDDDDEKILHLSWLMCGADGDAPGPAPDCDCSEEEDMPVCSMDSGTTYANMCEAFCQNDGMNVRDGECPDDDGMRRGGYGMYGGYGGYGAYGGPPGGMDAGINFRGGMDAAYGMNGGRYGGMYGGYGRNSGGRDGGDDGSQGGRDGGMNFREAMGAGYGMNGGSYGGMYGGYGGPRGGYGRYGGADRNGDSDAAESPAEAMRRDGGDSSGAPSPTPDAEAPDAEAPDDDEPMTLMGRAQRGGRNRRMGMGNVYYEEDK